MPILIEAYANLVARAHEEGNRVALGGESGQPQEVQVSKLGWFIIWFKDRLMPSSTRAAHARVLDQLEQAIQEDMACPLKEGGVSLIGRSFDKSSQNRSWAFLQRLQRVSEQLRSTVADPLLQGLDGSQMEFTMETYPTADNFERMLQQMQRAHEVRSKAATRAQGGADLEAHGEFTENPEVSRKDYIQFLKYIHDNAQGEKQVLGKNEPQLALAAMVTFRLAFPSPTRGRNEKEQNWDRVLDGAFYGCQDVQTAEQYYRLYQQYYRQRSSSDKEGAPLRVTDAVGLGVSPGRGQDDVPSRFPIGNRSGDEITPVVAEPVDRLYEPGIVLRVLGNVAKQAKNGGGSVILTKSTSQLEARHCSRLGKLTIWLRDKTTPARSSAKNREVLQELDRVLKSQFGFSGASAQAFLDARFPPEVFSDTPLFVDTLSETTSMLEGSERSFELLGDTGMVFTADNFPTLERFEMKAPSLLSRFSLKLNNMKTGEADVVPDESPDSVRTGDREDSHESESRKATRHVQTSREQRGTETHVHSHAQAFDRYQQEVQQDLKDHWEKYITFLGYLDKNMPEEQRIQDSNFKHKEPDIALSVFLLHEGLYHDQATADMHGGEVKSFSDTSDQVIANFTECHRKFSRSVREQETAV